MSKEFKNYKLTDKKTGKTITVSLHKSPTQSDVKKIFEDRATHERQKEISEATERNRGFWPRVADVLYAPSEAVAPKVLQPQEVEKLPISERLTRLGQETASGILDPANLPYALAPLLGPVGLAGAGIAAAPQMAYGTYETGKQAIEHPSLETVTRTALMGAGTGLAGLGIKAGLAGRTGKIVPKVEAPTKTPLPKSRQLEAVNPIEAEFVEPIQAPGRERLQITGDVPRTEEGAIRAPGIPKQERLAAPNTKLLTEAREEILPLEEAVPETLPTKETISTKETIQKPIENTWLREQDSSVLEAMKEGSTGQLRTEIEQVLGERGIREEIKSEIKPEETIKVRHPGREQESTKIPTTETEEIPKLDEVSFAHYQQELEDLIPLDRIDSNTLQNIVRRGKDAGLDKDTIVQDLIDNMPRINNATNRAYQAVNRVFRTGEAGFFDIGSLFGRASKKAKGTEAEKIINSAEKELGILDHSLPKPETVIGRMGDAGLRLERKMENAQYEADSLKGRIDMLAHESLSGLTPREIGQRIAVLDNGKEIVTNASNFDKFVDWTNGVFKPKKGTKQIKRMRGSLWDVINNKAEPANEKIAKAAEIFKQWTDILGDEGEFSGVSKISSEGKYIPFEKMEGFWPRSYTEGFFESLKKNPKDLNKIIQEISEQRGISLKEAEDLLKNKRNYSELTTRGQHERTFKQDSSVIDPEIVFDHIKSFSHRVGMAKALGPEDIRGQALNKDFQQLMNEGFDVRFASDTIARLVGREIEKNAPGPTERTIQKVVNDLNNTRLMTSFIINNLANVTTTIARVGPVNTLKGLGAMMSNFELSRRMATLSGATQHAGTIERGSSAISKALGIPLSERIMRTWADQSGRKAVWQLTTDLSEMKKSDPRFIRDKKLLDSLLGKDSIDTINRGVPTPEELSRAGWQLAKDSQGIINPATMPPLAENINNPALRLGVNLALQYKRMASLGMNSLAESFRLNPGRTIATISIIAPIIGEVIGDAGSALFGALGGGISGEGAAKTAIRDVNQRGESLAKAAKPILKDKLGLTDSQAKMVARYFDNMNRGFALGLIGDFIYSTAYWGGKAGADIVSGGISPAFEFAFDIAKSIMDGGKDMLYILGPQRLRSTIKRSEESQKGHGKSLLSVRPPRLSP